MERKEEEGYEETFDYSYAVWDLSDDEQEVWEEEEDSDEDVAVSV